MSLDFHFRLKAARTAQERQTGEAESLRARLAELQADLKVQQDQVSLLEKAALVLSRIGEERQQKMQEQIETLITSGLQTIFEQDMSFHIVSSVKGKSSTVEFIVRSKLGSGQVVETPVMESRGGGLASIVGFLLRIVILLLSRKDNDKATLFLDETFGMVSAKYETKLAEFLRELVDKTGIQIILVTHSNAYSEIADKQYNFVLKNGLTQVTED